MVRSGCETTGRLGKTRDNPLVWTRNSQRLRGRSWQTGSPPDRPEGRHRRWPPCAPRWPVWARIQRPGPVGGLGARGRTGPPLGACPGPPIPPRADRTAFSCQTHAVGFDHAPLPLRVRDERDDAPWSAPARVRTTRLPSASPAQLALLRVVRSEGDRGGAACCGPGARAHMASTPRPMGSIGPRPGL